MQSDRLAEPSIPSLAAAAAADRLAARAGAERPWRRWLLKAKSSPSTFGRLVFRLVGSLCIPVRSPPSSSDSAALIQSGRLIIRMSMHDVVCAALGLGAAGTIVLQILIAVGVITTHQQYFGMIYFCLTGLRGLLAAAGNVWDVYSGLMWLWEDMKLQRHEQQLQPSTTELIEAPPPPELDIC